MGRILSEAPRSTMAPASPSKLVNAIEVLHEPINEVKLLDERRGQGIAHLLQEGLVPRLLEHSRVKVLR